MSTPPAPAMLWCHGLDCSWSGYADELVKTPGQPDGCPKCGSFTPNKKRREAAKRPPIGEPQQPLAIDRDRFLGKQDEDNVGPFTDGKPGEGGPVDGAVEEYESAVIDLFRAERALQAAQARAQAALRVLNQGILARAGLE